MELESQKVVFPFIGCDETLHGRENRIHCIRGNCSMHRGFSYRIINYHGFVLVKCAITRHAWKFIGSLSLLPLAGPFLLQRHNVVDSEFFFLHFYRKNIYRHEMFFLLLYLSYSMLSFNIVMSSPLPPPPPATCQPCGCRCSCRCHVQLPAISRTTNCVTRLQQSEFKRK
jgi:hypothetical protein